MQNLSFITRKDPLNGEPLPAEGKRKIFLSYKRSDEVDLPLCEKLAEYVLKELDVAIWYDHKLTAGKRYDEEIQSAIAQSDAFILLLTPNILSSKYVLEQEIPFAIKQQVAIIPVIAGISENDIPNIENVLGRVHMPVWFFGSKREALEFSKDSREQMINGLKLAIANKNLLEQAKLFYEKGYQHISLRNLTSEQIFVKAYGELFSVHSNADKSLGIKLMESILGMYGLDDDFTALQEQVAYELLSHFYRTNQPDLFFLYMKSSLAKGFNNATALLINPYRDQWHPEILCRELDLSMALLKNLYLRNYGQDFCFSNLIQTAKQKEFQTFSDEISDAPHVGELIFDNHSAYFQKSNVKEKTVNLILDGVCVSQYDIYSSFGDSSFLFMAYSQKHHALITLYSDFDHYGPETLTQGEIYLLDDKDIKLYTFTSEWLKGIRPLPYSHYTFNI